MNAPKGGDYAFYTIFVGSLVSILLVAARQSALLLIDIADTLLHKNA
jgi:hypothetical protein